MHAVATNFFALPHARVADRARGILVKVPRSVEERLMSVTGNARNLPTWPEIRIVYPPFMPKRSLTGLHLIMGCYLISETVLLTVTVSSALAYRIGCQALRRRSSMEKESFASVRA
jgi:hypothetical protein